MTTARLDRYMRYGSMRILRDGRVRFSPWTLPELSFLSFMRLDDLIWIDSSGRTVMELDMSRGRVVSANFRYDLTPDELRRAVSSLREAGNGLERWIIPCIEHTCLSSTFREDYPEAYATARELLESCRDLPVAAHWKRVRETISANVENARAERAAKQAALGKRTRRRRSTGETS